MIETKKRIMGGGMKYRNITPIAKRKYRYSSRKEVEAGRGRWKGLETLR